MTEPKHNIRKLDNRETLSGVASTGVSMHCHSLHSKEILDFVPYYAQKIPVAAHFWARYFQEAAARGESVPDFSKGYWTPPLSAAEVVSSETENLRSLGLDALVSLTDHDSIDGCMEMKDPHPSARAPISMEWTVPFENAFFHIGVHNLPREDAAAISRRLTDYSKAEGRPDNRELHDLFALMNDIEGVLLVFNHPIWDIEMIGQQAHEAALARFVAEHGKWLHAIEINGFRSWSENMEAASLAASMGLPIVSGGDRHCLQSNTILNVTDARCFGEFVDEVRKDKHSSIVVLPEYSQPLPVRQLRSIAQILGRFDEFPEGRKNWHDRVFVCYRDDGEIRSLSDHWAGKRPFWTFPVFLTLQILNLRAARPIINWAVGDNDIGRDDRQTENGNWLPFGDPLAERRESV